jgi:hypothetical protein
MRFLGLGLSDPVPDANQPDIQRQPAQEVLGDAVIGGESADTRSPLPDGDYRDV